jgi:UDP-N-acetylmuramate dehydrogenase
VSVAVPSLPTAAPGPLAPEHDVPLAPRTTLELGGPAQALVRIRSEEEVAPALAWAEARGLPVLVLGGGSNLVVADAGFAGLVLSMESRGIATSRTEGSDGAPRMHVTAAAGEPWDAFVAHTVAEGWQGLECLSGIPGLVGATPVQNVGAYGQEVADTIVAVGVVDRRTKRARTLTPSECAFGYRDSALKRAPDHFVVTWVTFALRIGAPPALRYAELQKALATSPAPTLAQVRETVIALRRTKSMVLDPADPNRRSAGSFFTNPLVAPEVAEQVIARALGTGLVRDAAAVPRWPEKDGRVKLAAGWLIERAGIEKGLRRGPVGISSAHALALVHHGGGTTKELLALADEVRARVHDVFGVTLEREPVLVGA